MKYYIKISARKKDTNRVAAIYFYLPMSGQNKNGKICGNPNSKLRLWTDEIFCFECKIFHYYFVWKNTHKRLLQDYFI